MHPEQATELDWLAFRYIADELSSAECEAFENQLAEDQAAREAVARAVELSQLVLAAAHERNTASATVQLADVQLANNARRANWPYAATSMGVGAAACLLIAIGCAIWWQFGKPLPGAAPADTQALALASAWSSAREEFSEDEDALWNGELARSAVVAEDSALETGEDEPAFDDLAASATPSWMLSALGADVEEEANPESREN